MEPFVQLNAYTIVLLFGTIGNLVLAEVMWRRRQPAANAALGLLLTSSIWTFAAAMEALVVSIDAKVYWSVVAYHGIASTPLMFFLVAIHFVGRDRWLTKWRLIALCVIPLVSILMAATNDYHRLLWPQVTAGTGPFGVTAVFGHGPYFWVVVIYCYTLVALGIAALAEGVLRFPQLFARQARVLLVAAAAMLSSSLLYVVKPTILGGLDPTPLAFTVVAAMLALATLRLRWLEIMPVANEALLQSLQDGLLVLDEQQRIVTANEALRRLVRVEGVLVGEAVTAALAGWPELAALCAASDFHHAVTIQRPDLSLEVRRQPLLECGDTTLGSLVLLRDVTEQMETAASLARRYQLEGFVATLSRSFLNLPGEAVDNAIQAALTETIQITGVDRCFVMMLIEAEDRLEYTHEACARGVASLKCAIQWFPVDRIPWAMQVLGGGEAIQFRTADDLPPTAARERATMAGNDMKSVAVIPMITAHRLTGLCGMATVHQHCTWDEDTIALLRALSFVFAGALERREAQAALQRQRDFANTLMTNVKQGLTVMDAEDRFVYANPAFAQLLGGEPDDLLGRSILWVVHPDDRTTLATALAECRAGRAGACEVRLRRQKGEDVYALITPALHEFGPAAVGTVAIVTDLTARKQIEHEMTHARDQALTASHLKSEFLATMSH